MKELPILFSGEMVRAILDDRLLDLAAQAVAWLEARRAARLGLARERLEDTSTLGLPGGGQGGPIL